MENSSFRPIHSQPLSVGQFQSKKPQPVKGQTFALHLQDAVQENTSLTISKHASERLKQRNIVIADSRWEQIQEKVNEAKRLGVKDSLVLLENAALIVSAKNNTVITAMNRQEAMAQIFTNINGTIVLE